MTTKTNLPSLKAMAEGKVDGIQKATYFKVDPRIVEFEEGFNLREEGPALDAYLDSLYLAMKAGASVPPIDVSVVDGKVIARDGHCRTRVARRLIDEGIPYMLEARQYRGNEADCVLHMLGTAQGKPLTPLEQGRGFLRLVRYGMTVVKIVEHTGLHRNTIDNWLVLAEAPVEIQQMVSSDQVSAAVAVDMVRKHGKAAVDVLRKTSEKVKSEGGTKVTKQHVTHRVPQRVTRSLISAVSNISRDVDADDLVRLVERAPESKVLVRADHLKALLDVYCQVLLGDEGEL